MKQYKKNLGKVSITCEGVWDINKDYERLSIVYEANEIKSYISKIDVPQGISLENELYWMPITLSGSTEYTINNNIGFNNYPIFDENKEYNIGDIIVYNDILYKFTKYHAPGIWAKEDVINWTIKEDILDNTVKRYSIYNRSNNVLYRRIDISLFNYQDSAGYGVLIHTRRQHYILSSTSYLANPIEGQLFEIGTAYNDMPIGNGDLHVKLIPLGKNNIIRLYIALEPYSYISIETAGNLNFYAANKSAYDNANGIKCISLDFKNLVHENTLYKILSKGELYIGNVSFGNAENNDPVEVENTEVIGFNKDGFPTWGIFPNGEASFMNLFLGEGDKVATQKWTYDITKSITGRLTALENKINNTKQIIISEEAPSDTNLLWLKQIGVNNYGLYIYKEENWIPINNSVELTSAEYQSLVDAGKTEKGVIYNVYEE